MAKKTLDPVQGLIDYVLDIKPYHTKIVEVLIEYVYGEALDVTILDKTLIDIGINRPAPDSIGSLVCALGYSTQPFGDNGAMPILSPNLNIPIEQYPAINPSTDSFIVPGNQVTAFPPNSTIFLSTQVYDYSNVFKIADVILPSTFVIEDPSNQFSTAHPDGNQVNVTGSRFNSKSYLIDTSSNSAGLTTVEVTQTIISDVVSGQLGMVIEEPKHLGVSVDNTGEYTVERAEYKYGSIDSWPDSNDIDSYMFGDNDYTEVTITGKTFRQIPTPLGDSQVYVATVIPDRILIEGVLSYSNIEKMYDENIPELLQTPDEGIVYQDVVGVTISQINPDGSPIPDTGKFEISGNYGSSNVFVGDSIIVIESVRNNGNFTITSISYNSSLNITTFGVAQRIRSTDVDGILTFSIVANVFIIDSDFTQRFVQGKQFDIVGGNLQKRYTTLNSRYSGNKTFIRVIEEIFDVGSGLFIRDVVSNSFIIKGNYSQKYVSGDRFIVIGSTLNDGQHVVGAAGASYDQITRLTSIPVDYPIASEIGGEIHEFVTGYIKDPIYGYSDSSSMCDVIPETVVHLSIIEQLTFTGINLKLEDDIIFYNMENGDKWGFDFPIKTLIDDTQPTIPTSTIAPTPVEIGELWIDSSGLTKSFKRWTGVEWERTQTVYWFDSSTHNLMYRTMNFYNNQQGTPIEIDTGWLIDNKGYGIGFSSTVEAVGETQQIATQMYFAEDSGNGLPDMTYILNVPVPNIDPTLLKVYVENVPAEFILNTATEFTIITPLFDVGDVLSVEIFDRETDGVSNLETNAHVVNYSDHEPYWIYHRDIFVDGDTFIVPGGNFINRFITSNVFTGIKDSITQDDLDQRNTTFAATKFSMTAIDNINSTVTILGDYTNFFKPNLHMQIVQSELNSGFYKIESVTLVDGNTVIGIDPPPKQRNLNDLTTEHTHLVRSSLFAGVRREMFITGDHITEYTSGRTAVLTYEDDTTTFAIILQSSLVTDANGYLETHIQVVANTTNLKVKYLAMIVSNDFFSPGLVISDLDNVTNTITMRGNVETSYHIGQTIGIAGSTPANNGLYTVVNIFMAGSPIETFVQVSEDIIDPYPDTGSPSLQFTPKLYSLVDQNYTRDNTGLIYGALYDPSTTVLGQSSTIVLPSTPTNDMTDINAIYYTWFGPVRFDILSNLNDNVGYTFGEKLDFSDELGNAPIRFNIVDTDATEQYFDIFYVDPETGLRTSLTDAFPPQTIFRVLLSFDGANPSSGESNNALYLVNTSEFLDSDLDTSPGSLDNGWVTRLYIETDYNKIPPVLQDVNSNPIPFEITSMTNTSGSPNFGSSIKLLGDRTNILSDVAPNDKYKLDQPIISNDPLRDVITINAISFSSIDNNTTMDIDEHILDNNESYTGPVGMISDEYSGIIKHDEVTNPSWVHGVVEYNASVAESVARTLIIDRLTFGWGETHEWEISDFNQRVDLQTIIRPFFSAGSPQIETLLTAYIYHGDLILSGDQSGIINLNDRCFIIGSAGNDRQYEVESISVSGGSPIETKLGLRHTPRTFEVDTTLVGSPFDVSTLNGKYFLFSSGEILYYVWYDAENTGVDPGTDLITNPLLEGRVGVEVNIGFDSDLEDIAFRTQYAVVRDPSAQLDFKVSQSGTVVTFELLPKFNPNVHFVESQHVAVDFSTGFSVINFNFSSQPALVGSPPTVKQFGILRMKDIDITKWFQQLIRKIDPFNSTILLHEDPNAKHNFEVGQEIRVINTGFNDGKYTIQSIVYNEVGSPSSYASTSIIVAEPLMYGENTVERYLNDENIIKTVGKAANYLSFGESVNIVNSTGNNGSYTVAGISYSYPYSYITVVEPIVNTTNDGILQYNESGGWIESLRFQGINISFNDSIGVAVDETADAVAVNTSDKFVNGWDGKGWDQQLFNEHLGEILHLYTSNP